MSDKDYYGIYLVTKTGQKIQGMVEYFSLVDGYCRLWENHSVGKKYTYVQLSDIEVIIDP
jgi:hypothetical protein